MSIKPAKSRTDAREAREREAHRRPDPMHPSRNTRPRGNGERDDHDIDRGLERLTSVVGR